MSDILLNTVIPAQSRAEVTSLAQQARTAASNREQQRLKETSQEFETLFIEQMLNSMRKTVDRSANPLSGGSTEAIFEDLLYTEYARLIAKQGLFGIAEMIFDQVSDQQEASSSP